MINSPTIFTGADSLYWKKYGTSFVKSFHHYHPTTNIHIHLINPDQEDIAQLKSLPCNFTYELVSEDFISNQLEYALHLLENQYIDSTYIKNLKSSFKYNPNNSTFENTKLAILFTTYATRRFIKLAELWDGNYPVLAYDIDSICLSSFSIDSVFDINDVSCLSTKGDRFVISLVAFRNHHPMLKEWADQLVLATLEKKLYGFLDQDTFVELSNKYVVNKVDRRFCDHTRKALQSFVLTGKGTAKTNDMFINALNYWK